MSKHRIALSLLLFCQPLFALNCWNLFYACVDDSHELSQCAVSRRVCEGENPVQEDPVPTAPVACSLLVGQREGSILIALVATANQRLQEARRVVAGMEETIREVDQVLAANSNAPEAVAAMAGAREEANRRIALARTEIATNQATIDCANIAIAALPLPTVVSTPVALPPPPARTSVLRYRNPLNQDFIFLPEGQSPPPGYVREYPGGPTAFSTGGDPSCNAALYSCQVDSDHHFLSLASNCENQTTLGSVGFVCTTPGIGRKRIYRMYNELTGAHLYTENFEEVAYWDDFQNPGRPASGWNWETDFVAYASEP